MSVLTGCISDLAARWTLARRTALLSCLGHTASDASEAELVALAVAQAAEPAKKALFDNSLRLGRGFRRYYGATVQLQDLPELLPALGTACTDGVLQVASDGSGLLLLRRACAMQGAGPASCDLWHEALHGLFLGLTNGLIHTRHSSAGHGCETCVDAFHAENSSLRYGPIAGDDEVTLAQITRLLRRFDSSLSFELLGINDSTLLYRATSGMNSQLSVRSHFERLVRERLPHLSVLEVSPRPVFAG